MKSFNFLDIWNLLAEGSVSLARMRMAVLFIALGFSAAGCASSTPRGTPDGLSRTEAPGTPNYSTTLLQEGDVLNISFQYSTNFNVVQKIPLDGSLNLESIGLVKAAGTTPIELQSELAKRYKPQIKDDVITVKLLAPSSSVYIVGAVLHAGRIPMDRPMTVLEAVIEAGGYEPTRANLSKVSVLRILDGKQRTYRVNLKRLIEGREPTPFYLKPSDVVHVPTKRFNF